MSLIANRPKALALLALCPVKGRTGLPGVDAGCFSRMTSALLERDYGLARSVVIR